MIIYDNYSSPQFKKNLRYGVIYVLKALKISNELDMTSFLKNLLCKFTGFTVHVIESPDAYGTTLVSRRFNVGNTGKDSVVKMTLKDDSLGDIMRFAESATNVFSEDEGDQVLTSEGRSMAGDSLDNLDYIDLFENSDPKIHCLLNRFYHEAKESVEELPYSDYTEEDDFEETVFHASGICEEIPDELEEELEILTIEQKQQQALQTIQAQIIDYVRTYHADPAHLMNTLLEGKVVIGKEEQKSPLVVNNDLKIVLPHYNEMEVKMPSMCRSIYILFLKHTEGIVLSHISDYRAELENIYSMVMPGRSEEKAKEAIENLIDPMSNTLNEYISKIKRCFKTCILDEELANQYCITGKRGEPYRIALDPAFITLPRAVMG